MDFKVGTRFFAKLPSSLEPQGIEGFFEDEQNVPKNPVLSQLFSKIRKNLLACMQVVVIFMRFYV